MWVPTRWHSSVPAVLVISFCALISSDQCRGQETAVYFKTYCASCHTIGGGRLTGPDLKGVVERVAQAGKDRDWLINYIQDPPGMINSGDAYAVQLLQEASGVVMPKIIGLDAEKAGYLLELIETESLLEESQFKGAAISTEPFTAGDVERGLALFNGGEKLRGGATMCLSCHRMSGPGGLVGGKLGPDLTKVYAEGKYTTGGRATLSAWLKAPATPTMQSILQDQPLEEVEIHAIVALMENRAAVGQPDSGARMISFVILGLFNSVLILFMFTTLWNTRLRSVRRTLVNDYKIQSKAIRVRS